MNRGSLGVLGLRIRLALMRFGWNNSLVVMFCLVGTVSWLWGMPYCRARLELQQKSVMRARLALATADTDTPVMHSTLAEQRLANFYDALGEGRFAEQQVKTLFALAGKLNLMLSQAEYKFTSDKIGRYYTYQIHLPVKGSYAAIREFCEQTLLVIPFASLDEVNFKRDAITSQTLEAKLRFTLYLNGPTVAMQQTVVTAEQEDGR